MFFWHISNNTVIKLTVLSVKTENCFVSLSISVSESYLNSLMAMACYSYWFNVWERISIKTLLLYQMRLLEFMLSIWDISIDKHLQPGAGRGKMSEDSAHNTLILNWGVHGGAKSGIRAKRRLGCIAFTVLLVYMWIQGSDSVLWKPATFLESQR